MSKFHLLQLVRNKIGKRFQKSFKEELFFGVAVILTVFLFGILVFEPTLKSLSLWDFSFLTATIKTKLPSQDLFVEPAKNFLRDSPKMSFIQKNSVVGVSPPITITPQVLGSMLGGIESETGGRKEIIEYIVESGDTLSSIAAKFDISLNTILWAKDLNSKSIIRPGQKLIILPISGVLYMVERNDTLSEIAEIYKGEVGEIVDFNELSSEGDIYIGDILIIPGGEMPAKISSPPSVSSPQVPIGSSYFMTPVSSPYIITQGLHWYNAIDFSHTGNACGKPVYAAAGGMVQKTGYDRTAGNYVRISHLIAGEEVITFYGHLSSILVSQNQKVSQGHIIGYMGKTGYATGCHLHFEVRGAKNPFAK